MLRIYTLAFSLCTTVLAAAQVEISIGVRETGSGGGAPFTGIGDDGGTAGGIEWINLDGQTLILNGTWQEFTFTLAADPVTAFAGSTANGILEGTYGTLEHIRIKNTGGVAGPINLWIDDVDDTITGGSTTFGEFEGFGSMTEVTFQEPSFSGSTSQNLSAGSTSGVDNTVANSGAGSCKVRYEYITTSPSGWLRLTSFNASNQPNPQIRFDQSSVISFWMRGKRGTPGTFVTSGSGCPTPPLSLSTTDLANIGSTMTVTCSNLPVSTTATAMLFGTSTQSLALDAIGGTGCTLLVDAIFHAAPMTLAPPQASLDFSIGCSTGSIGNVAHLQAGTLAPGANALGVVLSDLGTLTIGAPPQPGADDCAAAPVIGDGLFCGDTFCATTSTPTGSCGLMGCDVWYCYSPVCGGIVKAGVCSAGGTASFDTVISVFTGSCGSLTEIICNDDTCGLQSEVTFAVTAGVTRYICLGGFRGDKGTYALSVECIPPVNFDECANAMPIGDGVVSGTNLGATNSATTGSCGSMGSDVWYLYSPACTGTATVSLCAANGGTADYDTVIAAFSGGCTALTEIICNDDSCGLQSEITFAVTAGTTYYIAVGGFAGRQGNFALSVSCR